MFDALRPFLSRIIAAAVASFSGWLAQRIGIEIDPTTQAAFAQVGVFIALVVYSIVHKMIDKKVNPGDNASSHLAVANKAKAAALKANNSLNYPPNGL